MIMENLKKLLTKCRRRGRPIFLALTTCFALTLLTIGVTNLYSYLSTQAAGGSSGIRLKAFCYDTLKDFKSYVKKQWGPEGEKSKYGAEIDADGGYLQCSTYPYCSERKLSGMKLTTAKLKERCDESDMQSPRRYWFWMKARDHFGGSSYEQSNTASERGALVNPFGTLAAMNPTQTLGIFSNTLTSLTSTQVAQAYTTWHTEYFYTSTNKLSQPFKAKSGENCVKIPMENLEEGGIIKSLGNTLSGNKSLDGYVVDIKPFYDKFMNKKKFDEFTDYIYLHTVVGVREPHKGDIITQNAWEAICGGWPNVSWEIPQSYNQWIQFVNDEPVKLQVYAVKSENDVPTKEELEYDSLNPNMLGTWSNDRAEKFSLVKFNHLGVWKVDDKEYALKGFTVERNYGTSEKPDWQGTKTFNISDNEFIAADDESKTTNDYGRMDDVIDNKFESDYAAETVVTHYGTYSFDLKKGDNSAINFDSGGSSLGVKHDGNMTTKQNKAISGKKTYEDLVNYMKNYALRVDIHDTRICLIYAEKPKAEVEVKVRPFNWSQSENKYVKDEEKIKSYTLGDVNLGNDGIFKLVKTPCVKTKKGELKTIKSALEPLTYNEVADIRHSISYQCGSEKVPYHLAKATIAYTGEDGTKYTIPKKNAPEWESDYTNPDTGDHAWNGKPDEEAKLKSCIDALYKQAVTEKADASKKVTIYLDYYQPTTPVVTAYYVHYYNSAGQECFQKVYDSTEKLGRDEGIEETHVNLPSDTDMIGEAEAPETINIGRQDGKYVMDGPDAGPVELDKELSKAWTVEVAGYYDADKDGWEDDKLPDMGELETSLASGKASFQTALPGTVLALVYTMEQPRLTVNVYSGICGGDVDLNPPTEPCNDHGFDSIAWNLEHTETSVVDTSSEESSKREVIARKTLAEMGSTIEKADQYGFIQVFASKEDDGGCVKEWLTPIGGDAYKILAEWQAAAKDSVVVNLYYLMFSETPPSARYTVIMYTGDSETTNVPITNPPSSCDEGKGEIRFQERARVQADISAKVRKSDVDVAISLKNTAEKMRTQGAQITEAGESSSSRRELFPFTPLSGEDLTQYGLIVTFNQTNNEKKTVMSSLGTDSIKLHWDKKENGDVTVKVYYVKLVPKEGPKLIVNYYYSKIVTSNEAAKNDPNPNTNGCAGSKAENGWGLFLKYESKPCTPADGTKKETCSVPSGTMVNDTSAYYMKGWYDQQGGASVTEYSGGGAKIEAALTAAGKDVVVNVYFVAVAYKGGDKAVPGFEDLSRTYTWNDITGITENGVDGPGTPIQNPTSEAVPQYTDGTDSNSGGDSNKPFVAAIEIAELANGSTSNMATGQYDPGAELKAQADIVLPNGTKSGSQYLPNKLKAAIEASAYASAGKVTKHHYRYKVNAYVKVGWDCSCPWTKTATNAEGEEVLTSGSHSHGSGTDPASTPGNGTNEGVMVDGVNYRKFTLQFDFVWYELKEVYLWSPEEGRVYSYAFPDVDGSLDTKADKTREYEEGGYAASGVKAVKKFQKNDGSDFDAYSYFIGLEPGTTWRDPRRSDNFSDYGIAKKGDAMFVSDVEKLFTSNNAVTGWDGNKKAFFWSDSVTYNPHKCDHDSSCECDCTGTSWQDEMKKRIKDKYKSILAEKIKAFFSHVKMRSDALSFFHPAWEDLKGDDDIGKVSIQTMFGNDDYSYSAHVAGPFEGEVSDAAAMPAKGFDPTSAAKYTAMNTSICNWDLDTLRIPEASISNYGAQNSGLMATPGGKGAGIPQEKVNSKSGPKTDSAAEMIYRTVSYQDSNTSSPFWLWTDNCNKVELYTPVALTMSFASTRIDLLQTTGDGSADVPRITMGTPFQLSLDYHGTFEPYGSIDTSAYLWEKDTLHMTFEYPVYADGAYHEAGETWTQNSVPGTTFYPAYWAVEDLWSFQGVSDALNVVGVDGSASLHSRVGSMEKEANTDAANHQAWNDLMNRVDGILTGMRITDVADYPYLQYVFRDGGEGSPLTYKKSGYAINSGWKTFQGLTHLFNFGAGPQPEQTFPVVDGDTVGYKPYTVFKPGYKI